MAALPLERPATTLTAEEIAEAIPGASAFRLMARFPGTNPTGADRFGTYEWGNDLSLRGFTAGQVGWMLDGIPLGSTHYWYNMGLDLHRAIASDDLGALTLMPGSASGNVASYSALGGAFLAQSRDPARATGAAGSLMIGEDRAVRLHLRGESGELASGGRGFVSLSSLTSNKWKGMGDPGQNPLALFNRDGGDAVTAAGARWGNYHDQVTAKWVQPLGRHSLTLFGSYSDKRENDYADLTLPILNARGYRYDNYQSWPAALQSDEVAFGSAASWRRDTLLAATLNLDAGARWTVTPYWHSGKGNGDWHMPTTDDDGRVILMQFRRSKMDTERKGVNSAVEAELGAHRLTAGLWWEDGHFDRRRYLYPLYNWQTGPQVDLATVDATLLDRHYRTTVWQGWARDTYTLRDDWSLISGFKTTRITTDFRDELGVYATRSLQTRGDFLPEFGAVWRQKGGSELFAHFSENVTARPLTVFTQRVYDDSFRPERSRTVEAGWRHNGARLTAMLSVYLIDYRNRLLQIANCSLMGTCPSQLENVGSVASRGVEATWRYQIDRSWRWLGAINIGDAHYRQDYLSGGSLVPTQGKQVVNSPAQTAFTELRREGYNEFGKWHLGAAVNFTGHRYATYTNDYRIPSYTLWSFSGGIEAPQCGIGKHCGVQWRIENAFNRQAITTLGSAGYYAYDPDRSQTYFQVGAPRGAYVTFFAEL